ncbi:MAG: response regulator [Sinobacterium sp.]|nr:response regulator [Sinobacterium sp.]
MPDKAFSVLIVDDSFLMRRILTNILELDSDFSIAGEASDGIDALEKLTDLNPDIILLDIEMPRMGGIEFLRLSKILTDAKVIIVSSVANVDSPQAKEALELGVVDIIHKPSGVLSLDMEEERSNELLQVIRKAVGLDS